MSSSKTIAKNTLFLFARMFVTMIISLYTSRVVLEYLGFVDYGIYNVVGGVVIFIAFLQSSLSSATARFLNIALAGGDKEVVSKTFSNAFIIHLFLCFIILLIGETVGLYFIKQHLNFPAERVRAVGITYQLSLITCCISVLQIPYYALLIAYEKMKAIAYLGVLQSLLSLGIVYMLSLNFGDNLIVYAILVFLVSLLIRLIYILYCKKNIKESKLILKFDAEIARPIITFFSWDLYGNFSVAARGEGVLILLNMFFGALINASTGISNQLQGMLNSFIDNFLIAIRPQLVQSYAKGEYSRMFSLVFIGSKMSFILMLLISLPLYIYMELVLKLWLKNVPEYAVNFCRLSLIFTLISILFRTIMFAIHATGRVKIMSVINGTLYILILPFSYYSLYLGNSPESVFVVSIILMFFGQVSNTLLLKRYVPCFRISFFYRDVILRSIIVSFLAYRCIVFVASQFDKTLLSLAMVSIFISVIVFLLSYYIEINKKERKKVILFIKEKWKRIY